MNEGAWFIAETTRPRVRRHNLSRRHMWRLPKLFSVTKGTRQHSTHPLVKLHRQMSNLSTSRLSSSAASSIVWHNCNLKDSLYKLQVRIYTVNKLPTCPKLCLISATYLEKNVYIWLYRFQFQCVWIQYTNVWAWFYDFFSIHKDECVSQLLCCLQVAYEAERELLHTSVPLIHRCWIPAPCRFKFVIESFELYPTRVICSLYQRQIKLYKVTSGLHTISGCLFLLDEWEVHSSAIIFSLPFAGH